MWGLALAGCASERSVRTGTAMSVEGRRGPLPVYLYKPTPPVRGVIVFASGDGGWKSFEEKICANLAAGGFCVVGWDSLKYAGEGPYDQAILASDFYTAAAEGAAAVKCPPVPLVFAGYSTGAEQAVAAAAWHPRLRKLSGVLVVAPGKRGRYGITTADLMGLTPTGKGSFDLTEHSPGLEGLRLFQIHGQYDPLAQSEWLSSLTIPHSLVEYPDGWHTFKGGPADFQELVLRGVKWVLDEKP